MEPLWERVRSEWKGQGLTIRPGATAARFAAFEHSHGVRLPPDLRDYLGTVDGHESGEWAAGVVRFCPLEEIKPAGEFASYRLVRPLRAAVFVRRLRGAGVRVGGRAPHLA